MPIVAWYMLSNESYMKRVMRDVLPTVHPYQQMLLPPLFNMLRTALFA